MMKYNTYCIRTGKQIDEMCKHVELLTVHRDTLMHIETVKDARIRLEVLSSLKNLSRRIESFLNEVNTHQHEQT